MTVNLRLALTVFKVGFAVESASGFFALVSGAGQLPFNGLLLILTPASSAVGILFLWVGRHEWNELHRSRVGHANLAFAVSLVATVLAAAPIAYLTAIGDPTPPGWLAVEFGAAIAVVFGITFVTYALVAAHLVGRLGEIAMGAGLVWAVVLSAAIGFVLAPQLDPIVQTIAARSPAIDPIVRPITLLDALLAFSYLAFFLAFTDAHYRVALGLVPEDDAPDPQSANL
jgi:Na+/phosphate symporter